MMNLHGSELDACLAALARQGGGRYPPLAGQVHSVFHTALNFTFGEVLVCLLGGARSLHPWGLVLTDTPDFEALGLAPGQPAALTAMALTTGGAAGVPALAVNLSGAVPQDLSVGALSTLTPPAAYSERLATLAAVITQSPGAEDGLAPALSLLAPRHFPALPQNRWCAFLLPRLRALPAVLLRGNTGEIQAAGRSLAGCGPGLTPASDDLLVGLMAGMLAADAAGAWPAPGAPKHCRALARGAQGATGTIPAAYLGSAGQGYFSRDILSLLLALFSLAGPGAVRTAAQQVAQFGASSGSDLLAGLWLALAIAAHIC